jgi:hypothetical protein
MHAPILFCHYGNSDYLRYTLRAARLFNPEKRIVLLGDRSNLRTAKQEHVEHRLFERYAGSEQIKIFNAVYRHVAGSQHGKKHWTNFVFKRWFYIHAFVKAERIGPFWHFDSDNLLISALEGHENKFSDYDCTEQCNGGCMNGLITSFRVVDGYVKKINALFQDEHYLETQEKDFINNPRYAFTEMRAYKTYKEQEHINGIRLNTIINEEIFDDCICQNDGMETYELPLNGKVLKKLYYSSLGHIYCKCKRTSQYIRMNSINMSWVPTYLYRKILDKSKMSANYKDPVPPVTSQDLQVLDIYTPPAFNRLGNLVLWFKNILPQFEKFFIC